MGRAAQHLQAGRDFCLQCTAEESHKEEIAAREMQIMHFCQELDAITQQLESLRKAEA